MKIIEALRNFFTKKNIKELCKKIWGKEPEPVDESVFDDPDRYVKFDDWKDKQYWEDKKRYKREKRLLTLRRFCVSVISILLVTLISATLIKSMYLFVKTNEFLSCAGRDVCIYLGPKRIYPGFMLNKVIGLNNGDAFVITYTSEKNYVEYYNKIFNRFSKIKDKRNIKVLVFQTMFDVRKLVSSAPNALIKNSNGDIVIIDDQAPIELFDVKNKKFIPTEVNLFNYRSNQHSYNYLTPYIDKYSLIKSNNAVLNDYNETIRQNTTKFEKLYLFDNDNYSITEMPSLAQSSNYFPQKNDIIILNNGKIILPIIYKYVSDPSKNKWAYAYSSNVKPITDHIEIYDPSQNRFIAETNKDILKDNILHIVQPNNDVIFLNKNSTYFFINKDNKFIKANEELTRRNQKTVEKLAKLMFEHMGLDIEEIFGVDRVRVIQLAPQKFLITCNSGHMAPFDNIAEPNNSIKPLLKKDLGQRETIQACRNTVYYDYEKNIIKKGPKFIQPHFSAQIAQLSNNLFIVVGGKDFETRPPAKPNDRVQFIKVKN